MEKMQSKYITITLYYDTGKTKIYRVVSKEYNFLLGEIRWYGAWRCYAFMPEGRTVFEKTCLKDITKFLENLMLERKAEKQNAIKA